MPRLFAIADLHLSIGGNKPMHIFGEQWRDHDRRMAKEWDASVAPDDTVLLPGDLSWGRSLAEAEPDLAWIAARPGRKILLRGNHDSWWSSLSKLRRALPQGCELLQNDALALGDWTLVGARGWLAPDDPIAQPSDEPIFRRELERLELSIRAADRLDRRTAPRVAMLHYPPWLRGRSPTDLVPPLKAAGVRICVYGHLHGEDHALGVTGLHDGIDYQLVAADAIGFRPQEIVLGRE